ncbi:MAG: hypothetical protein JWO70_4344, partial [Betaproteobacteria bacterium]|nr:hypothetical protein [Betaproteobacteria bacterium]
KQAGHDDGNVVAPVRSLHWYE